MKEEYTLVLIKPGVIGEGRVERIIKTIEAQGLRLTKMRPLIASQEQARSHYNLERHRERPSYEDLIAYMTSGPLVALIFKGPDAIALTRRIIGPTLLEDGKPGEIRFDFQEPGSPPYKNPIHASDSPEEAKRERKIWFSERR